MDSGAPDFAMFDRMREAFACHELILDDAGVPRDYRFLEVNAAFSQLTGLDRDAIVGRTVRELIPDIEPLWIERYGRVVSTGVPERFEEYSPALGRLYDVSAFPVGPLRFATLFSDITEARRVQEELRSDELRLQSLVRILQYDSEDDQDLLDFALAEAVELTRSRYGYIYLYDEDRAEFTLNSWSGLVMEHCAVVDPRTVYRLSETGFWGEAVRRRTAIVDNDFAAPDPLKKGYPHGHVAITRFASAPIILSGRIVAVVGVANKEEPYGDGDIRQLQLLLAPVFSRIERAQAIRKKKESLSLFQAIIDSVDDVVFTMDGQGRFTGLYGRWVGAFGLDPRECAGKAFGDLFGEAGRVDHERAFAAALGGQRGTYEFVGPGAVAERAPVFQCMLSPIVVDGSIVGVVGVARDVTSLVAAQRRLTRSLDEKQLLVMEIQHRVKNNLQMVISLMELQSTILGDSRLETQLRGLQRRVHAISFVHTLLAEEGAVDSVPLEGLLDLIASNFDCGDHTLALQVRSEGGVRLPVDVAIPVSLIVDELIANCRKHARRAFGPLSVGVLARRMDAAVCELTVSDDGDAPASGKSGAEGVSGFGGMLLEGLVAQISGAFSVERGAGYTVRIRFPVAGAGKLRLPALANGVVIP